MKVELYECQCEDCKLKYICGLLGGQYCPYYNCIVPK